MAQDLSEYFPDVKQIASRIYYKYHNRYATLEMNDLFHEGICALILLYNNEKLDNTKKTSFWNFARIRVEGAMKDYLRKQPIVRVPQEKIDKLKEIKKIQEEFSHKLFREPMIDEIANSNLTNLTNEKIHEIKNLDFQFSDVIEEKPDQTNQYDEIMMQKFHQDMRKCLNKLEDKIKIVFIARFKDNISLKKLAISLEVSHQTVLRWQQKACLNIRNCLSKKEIDITDLYENEFLLDNFNLDFIM